ncbi:MAG: EAL domain-containing protein, partial [Rhodospirillaceae bacterium]|nr:EAL domain-containing protein [Rhodospirillaceae bacterium]
FELSPGEFAPSYDSVMSRIHPEDRAAVAQCVEHSIAARIPCVIDHRILVDGDRVKWVHERGETRFDGDGAPIKTIGTVQDITARVDAENKLRRERDFSSALIDGLPGIFFVLDKDGRNIRFNDNLADVTGLTNSELQGLNALDVIAVEDRDRVADRIRRVFETGQAEDEFDIVHRDGGKRRLLAHTRRLDLDGGPGILGIGVDVTAARRHERLLLESEEKLRTIFESVSDGISLSDPVTGKIVDLNRAGWEMAGYTRDELIGQDIAILSSGTPPFTQDAVMEWVSRARKEGAQTFEWQCRRKNASLFWTEMTIRFTKFGGRELILATIRDITARKRDEQRILQMARFDGLTGLANRQVFADAVQQAIARAQRGEKGFAVLYLDLDHFKDINDTLGHPVGDSLLKAIAERLRFCVRATDTVARFGGDEFAVLAAEIDDPVDAGVLAKKIIEVVSRPAAVEDNEIRIGTSIGIAVYGPDSPDAEVLLSHADVALYRAKWEGRGIYRFFTDAMDAAVRHRVSLDADLRAALAAQQFFILYQPQVDSLTGRITGVEALVRWRHPRRGVISPDKFVPVAETSGLIVPLGRWVLGEVCRTAKGWKDAGILPAVFSVNVSALQFKTPGELEHDIATALAENGLAPQNLELELTETVLMDASREHNDALLALRASGIRLAIDDFGTGYSSLDYLRQYPVDRIKIAQVFIADLLQSQGDVAIVKAAISLARELGINIIAEGVETLEQLSLLQDWGCREVQGYFFAKPLTPDELIPILRRGRIRPVQGTLIPEPA